MYEIIEYLILRVCSTMCFKLKWPCSIAGMPRAAEADAIN